MSHIRILFSGPKDSWAQYRAPLTAALNAEQVLHHLDQDVSAPETVDYIVYAPGGAVSDFSAFARTRAVLSLWVGVEGIVGNPTLTQPLARMIDEGLRQGMVEWVAGHVLRHHLGLDQRLHGQDGIWRADIFPPLARNRPVAVLGLGALGAACAQALSALGFPVLGWSRRQRQIPGVACLAADGGLEAVLAEAQILVTLLPLPPQTTGLLDARRLALMPNGAVVINPGRGPLIVEGDLLDALNSGQLGAATLDVFATEPLPPRHAFWAHPKVTVTPHIASATRPDTASLSLARNIAGHLRGAPLQGLVDRAAGY